MVTFRPRFVRLVYFLLAYWIFFFNLGAFLITLTKYKQTKKVQNYHKEIPNYYYLTISLLIIILYKRRVRAKNAVGSYSAYSEPSDPAICRNEHSKPRIELIDVKQDQLVLKPDMDLIIKAEVHGENVDDKLIYHEEFTL